MRVSHRHCCDQLRSHACHHASAFLTWHRQGAVAFRVWTQFTVSTSKRSERPRGVPLITRMAAFQTEKRCETQWHRRVQNHAQKSTPYRNRGESSTIHSSQLSGHPSKEIHTLRSTELMIWAVYLQCSDAFYSANR